MSIEQKLRKESIFQVQSVFNVMVCFDQRFAVKNSGLSCLALIFYLSNSNIKILNSTLFQQGAEILCNPWPSVPQQQLLQTMKHNVFVLTCPICSSSVGVLPQELGYWFCSQNLWLSSGLALGSGCQMTCRCLNLDSNLTNKFSWFYQLWNPWITCVDFKFFLALPKMRPAVRYFQTWKPLFPRMVGSTIKN